MANIENIVKVMNFHSLLRVDKAKRNAEKYFNVEEQLNKVMCEIYYNKNIVLDKKIISENADGETINIYIGNDMGFCGNFNTLVMRELRKDKTSKKIVIGKKMIINDSNVLLFVEKENFNQGFIKIQNLIYKYINERRLKEINLVYNHYYNTNDIRFKKTKVFPAEIKKVDDLNLNVDFISETNINQILSSLLSYYVCYEILIAEGNSLASENIMRERITHDALDKIETRNEEKEKAEKKAKKYRNFKKQLDNYRKVEDK